MPCTSDSGYTSEDVCWLGQEKYVTPSRKGHEIQTHFFLPTAHLTEHFNVIALKLAICFDCIHHSKQRSFAEHLHTSFSREVRGQQSVTECSMEAFTDLFLYSRTFLLNVQSYIHTHTLYIYIYIYDCLFILKCILASTHMLHTPNETLPSNLLSSQSSWPWAIKKASQV